MELDEAEEAHFRQSQAIIIEGEIEGECVGSPLKRSKKQKYLNPPQRTQEEEEEKGIVAFYGDNAYKGDDLFYSTLTRGKEKSIRISMCEMEFESDS